MRIVHVASGREWRGGQNQVALLARAIQAQGGAAQVVVTGGGTELERRLRAAGVPVRAATWRAGVDPRVAIVIWSETAARPAILHAHDPHALILASIVSALRRVPLVVTRRVDFHLRRRLLWRRAAMVVAVSGAVRDVLLADGLAPERVAVVHSGIDIEESARVGPAAPRRVLGLPAEARLVVNVAALVPHKDHATLIDAAALLAGPHPDVHWIVAGEGPLRPALEARVARLGLRGRVHLLGHVPDPRAQIAAADLFVLSSREEGLGTTLLDAMALGVPIVATRAGGIPEIVADGCGVLVAPGDARALAAAMARLLGDPARRAALAGAARARVQGFSHLRTAERMMAIYARIGGGREGGPAV